MRWDLVAAVALGLLLTACEAGNAMPKAGGAQPAVTGTIFAPGGARDLCERHPEELRCLPTAD